MKNKFLKIIVSLALVLPVMFNLSTSIVSAEEYPSDATSSIYYKKDGDTLHISGISGQDGYKEKSLTSMCDYDCDTNKSINFWNDDAIYDSYYLMEEDNEQVKIDISLVVKKVVFDDPIKPISTWGWFKEFWNLDSFENWDNLDVSYVQDMTYMFGCYGKYFNNTYKGSGIKTIDVSKWNVSNCKDFTGAFEGFVGTTLDVSNWDVSSAEDMQGMFDRCTNLTSLDVSKWNTSNVTRMQMMFQLCTHLKELNISNWNTSKVTDMSYMLNNVGTYTGLSFDLSSWDTSNLTNISFMFQRGVDVDITDDLYWTLNISGWDLSKCTNATNTLKYCNTLKTIYMSQDTFIKGINGEKILNTSTGLLNGNGPCDYPANVEICITGTWDDTISGHMFSNEFGTYKVNRKTYSYFIGSDNQGTIADKTSAQCVSWSSIGAKDAYVIWDRYEDETIAETYYYLDTDNYTYEYRYEDEDAEEGDDLALTIIEVSGDTSTQTYTYIDSYGKWAKKVEVNGEVVSNECIGNKPNIALSTDTINDSDGQYVTYNTTKTFNVSESNVTDNATFICSGPAASLKAVYLNGTLVSNTNYDVIAGSTVVNLKYDYLKTLKSGEYTVKLEYNDDYPSVSFGLVLINSTYVEPVTPATPVATTTPVVASNTNTFNVGDTAATSNGGYATLLANGTVSYKNKSVKTKWQTVPKTVTVYGKTYNVSTIKGDAFNGSYVKVVTLQSNITKLNAKAFSGDKKLTTIKIYSKKLSVGSNLFKNISNKQKKKIKVVVSKNMSKKNFNTLKKALVKQGLKSSNITRK